MSAAASHSLRLAELAEASGAELVGDPDLAVRGVRTLERAGRDDLSFLTRAAFLKQAEATRAAALLVPSDLAQTGGLPDRPLLIAKDPTWALARIIALFHPPTVAPAGVHATAVVGQGCEIDPSAHIGPYVVVGEGSVIGAEVEVRAHAVIGRHCQIAAGAVLHPHVVLYDGTEVGQRTVLHAGVVLGADGFGYATRGGEHLKVPQVGHTVVEADVEIGALSAVDRALLEETRVGAGTKIDNLVQVGHNVQIGRSCLLCGQAGVAGSARLGDHAVLGGQSGVADHVEVGSGVQAAGKSAILQSVEQPGLQVGGIPAVDLRKWRRQVAGLDRLGRLARRLRALEKRVEKDS
ncbi:MAG: UDP-3-O-(3-hydroxymyristoyl)glucosamine N-acyltransferase [Acidobacteriota bacterium]